TRLAARDDPGGLRLLARGGVLVEGATRCGGVDPALELEVRRPHAASATVFGRGPQPTGQRLHGRPVAQVLEPLPGGHSNALLLLLDARHNVKNARSAGGRHGTRALAWALAWLDRAEERAGCARMLTPWGTGRRCAT